MTVAYLDAEMGRIDVHERLDDLGLAPADLGRLHYSDIVPHLDTMAGASKLYTELEELKPALLVVDGLNGAVMGAENDDTTWRDFYDGCVGPLKRLGIAIVTNDNCGKDRSLGPRGSSVKLDKPDAVIQFYKTDDGVKLVATHRRSHLFPKEAEFTIHGVEGDQPIHYRRAGEHLWPAGTKDVAADLDALGLSWDVSKRAASKALREAGKGRRAEVVNAACRYRRELKGTFGFTPSRPVDNSGTMAGTTHEKPQQGDWVAQPVPTRAPAGPTPGFSVDNPEEQIF